MYKGKGSLSYAPKMTNYQKQVTRQSIFALVHIYI